MPYKCRPSDGTRAPDWWLRLSAFGTCAVVRDAISQRVWWSDLWTGFWSMTEAGVGGQANAMPGGPTSWSHSGSLRIRFSGDASRHGHLKSELGTSAVKANAPSRVIWKLPNQYQKSMPPPPGMGGVTGLSFGSSATMASVVIRRPATDAASCSAARTTFAGSTMPASTRST